jgi:hypothetical protein
MITHLIAGDVVDHDSFRLLHAIADHAAHNCLHFQIVRWDVSVIVYVRMLNRIWSRLFVLYSSRQDLEKKDQENIKYCKPTNTKTHNGIRSKHARVLAHRHGQCAQQ